MALPSSSSLSRVASGPVPAPIRVPFALNARGRTLPRRTVAERSWLLQFSDADALVLEQCAAALPNNLAPVFRVVVGAADGASCSVVASRGFLVSRVPRLSSGRRPSIRTIDRAVAGLRSRGLISTVRHGRSAVCFVVRLRAVRAFVASVADDLREEIVAVRARARARSRYTAVFTGSSALIRQKCRSLSLKEERGRTGPGPSASRLSVPVPSAPAPSSPVPSAAVDPVPVSPAPAPAVSVPPVRSGFYSEPSSAARFALETGPRAVSGSGSCGDSVSSSSDDVPCFIVRRSPVEADRPRGPVWPAVDHSADADLERARARAAEILRNRRRGDSGER